MTLDCLPHQVRPAGPRSDYDAVLTSCGLPWAWALLRTRRSRLVRATHRARSFDARDGSHHPRVRCGAADGLRRCSMARSWPIGTVACTQQHGWALRWALGAEVGAGRCTGWHRARRTRHDTMPCAWGVMPRARSRVGTRGAAPGFTHRHAHACVGPSRSRDDRCPDGAAVLQGMPCGSADETMPSILSSRMGRTEHVRRVAISYSYLL